MSAQLTSAQKQVLTGGDDFIRPSVLARIAFSNLFYKKLRTTLTIIGVVVGIGAVVFLLAFGYGLRDLVTDQVVNSNSIRTIDMNQANPAILKLDTNTEEKILSYNGVESVSRVFNFAGQVNYENSKTGVVVYGTDQRYMELNSFPLVAGSGVSLRRADEGVVNTSLLKAMGIKKSQQVLNKRMVVDIKVPEDRRPEGMKEDLHLEFKIVSVIESGTGAEFFVSKNVFINNRIDTASQAKVLVKDKEDIDILQKRIASLGFTTSSPLDTVQQIDDVFGVINYIFLGFGGIGLVIAVLGMFNTLTITLLERTKEIGLMRTLGARRRDIRRLFILESMGLSFLGGVFGILSSYLFSRIINHFFNSLATSRGLEERISMFSFRTSLLLWVIIFSLILGLVVVYFPARRAARMNAIEALHS